MSKRMIFLDNSRISAFKSCPMQYFMRHKLGWAPAYVRAALEFGGAWHEGKAAIFNAFKDNAGKLIPHVEAFKAMVMERARAEFLKEWYKRGMPDPDDMAQAEKLFPRVPGLAYEQLNNFLNIKFEWLQSIEVLEVERPFAVPLFENDDVRVFLIGRKDAVMRNKQGVWALEHKTTSLKSNKDMCKNGAFFQYKFLNMFDMSPQVNGYTFSLKMEYGTEAMGVYILGSLIHKDVISVLPKYGIENAFKMIPVFKSDEVLRTWFHDTRYWIEQMLEAEKTGIYAHNESGCTHQYGNCDFFDVCKLTSDPKKLPMRPENLKVEFWQPFDESQLEKIIKEIEDAS